MEELKKLKEQQKILLSARILDLIALNEINSRLYKIRQERAKERARAKAQAQEQKQAARINAIFER